MNIGLGPITKNLKYGDRPQPSRDWLVLLVLFLVGLAICVIYSLLTFSKVIQGQQVGNATTTVPAQIQLNQVDALFHDRAAARERYNSEYRFVDPSL